MAARVLPFTRSAAAARDVNEDEEAMTNEEGRAAVRRLADILQILALTRPRAAIAVATFALRLIGNDSMEG